MTDADFPSLGSNLRDRVASIARGAGALVPHGGHVIGTLIGSLIPGQRMDRLEKYVAALRAEIGDLKEAQEKIIAASPEHIDLFEEGAFRSARALSEERIRHFALIVAIGMTRGTAEAIAQKRLLTILSDLDEQDIIMLNWRIQINKASGGIYAAEHPDLLRPRDPPTTVFSSREDREENALREAITNKLLRYGLVELVDDRVPQGMSPRKREQVSELGRLILRTVGLIENESAKW